MHNPHRKWSSNQVDWSDPRLDALLKKTESWSLDNRGVFPEQTVLIHMGWGATSGRPARLVWEREQAIVLVTDYPIPPGEPLRIDRHTGDSTRSAWGSVVDSRQGLRDEDRAQGLQVHWVHMR